jgi:hypothetical protein
MSSGATTLESAQLVQLDASRAVIVAEHPTDHFAKHSIRSTGLGFSTPAWL